MEVLRDKFPQQVFSKFYLWSDGCAQQYKGKNSFFHLSEPDLLYDCERNFFVSEHGKHGYHQ